LAFLFLDQALGEYNVETGVGQIDVRPALEAPQDVQSLDKRRAAFDLLVLSH
jgi:hypothetical protein